MTDVVPTGEMGKAMVNLKNLIAESTTFQDAVGASGTPEEKIAAAKEHLHLSAYTPEDGDFARPFGLIVKNASDKSPCIALGTFVAGGDMELWLEQEIPTEYKDDDGNAELYFMNFVDGVIGDCKVLGSQAGYLAVNSYDVIEGPLQHEVTEGFFVYLIRVMVNWGLVS